MRSNVTVTAPAASKALVTLGTVQAESGLGSADAATLARLIDRASAAIAGYLGRPLARETVVETFRDVAGFPFLLLSRWPVASIASVVVDGEALAVGQYEIGGADARQLHRLEADATSDWTAAKVVVTYTAGYILPGAAGADLPPEIEWAALLTVVSGYHLATRDPQLRSEAAEGIGSQSWLDPEPAAHGGLPWAAAERLMPYRRHDR